MPRNRDKPERPAKYGLSSKHAKLLSEWMKRHFSLATWPKPEECESLLRVEIAVLGHWEPPLNLKDINTPWTAGVCAARKVMADDAREWARKRGLTI